MTPEERAEKMLEGWLFKPMTKEPEVIEYFAAQIREAIADYAEERVKENMGNPVAANPFEWFCKVCRPIAEELGKQARSNALEEAANVAQFYSPIDLPKEHRVTPWAAGDIANRIRDLKSKP